MDIETLVKKLKPEILLHKEELEDEVPPSPIEDDTIVSESGVKVTLGNPLHLNAQIARTRPLANTNTRTRTRTPINDQT